MCETFYITWILLSPSVASAGHTWISQVVTTPRPQMLGYFAIVLIVFVSTAFLERNFYEVADLRGTYQEENLIPEDYDDSDSTRGKRSSFYRSVVDFRLKL